MYLFQYILLVSASLAVALPNPDTEKRQDIRDCTVNARAEKDFGEGTLQRYRTLVMGENVPTGEFCGHYKAAVIGHGGSNVQCYKTGDGTDEYVDASFAKGPAGVSESKKARDLALKDWIEDSGCKTG